MQRFSPDRGVLEVEDLADDHLEGREEDQERAGHLEDRLVRAQTTLEDRISLPDKGHRTVLYIKQTTNQRHMATSILIGPLDHSPSSSTSTV